MPTLVGKLSAPAKHHSRMAWIYCAPASVGANLGWHDLGVRETSSTHGVDLLRPAFGGCQPWLASFRRPRNIIHAWRGSPAPRLRWVPTLVGTISAPAKHHPRMAWISCAPASVGANLGWHDLGVRGTSSTHGVDLLRSGFGGCQPWLARFGRPRNIIHAWRGSTALRLRWVPTLVGTLSHTRMAWISCARALGTMFAAARPRDSRVSPASQALAQPQDASCTCSTDTERPTHEYPFRPARARSTRS